MKALSASIRQNIIQAVQNGMSDREVAEATGVSKGTVYRVKKAENIDSRHAKDGRPSKLSSIDVRKVVRSMATGECETAIEATRQLNAALSNPVSDKTVRRALGNAGMRSTKAQRKPMLKIQHRAARLKWANAHREWTVEDWKRVAWSDETKINRMGSDGKNWKWLRNHETGLEAQHVIGTLKFGGGNVMIWGCMSAMGVGEMAFVVGNMDADQYISILDRCMMRSVEKWGMNAADFVFQQDNDPKHTVPLARRKITSLPKPLRSYHGLLNPQI